MAITFIPSQPDAIDRFTEAFSPYLQMMAEAKFKQRMAEQEKQKSQEQMAQMFPGAFEKTYPNAQLAQPYMRSIDEGGNPSLQQEFQSALGKVPNKYKKMAQKTGYKLNTEGAAKYPGMEFSPQGASYKVPQKGMFENIVVGQDGQPSVVVNGQVIPISSVSKSGFTTKREDKPPVSPSAAMNMLADPVKANFLKRDFPDIYNYLSEISQSTVEGVPPQTMGKYKSGDTKVVNGVVYVRNEKGEWLPQ